MSKLFAGLMIALLSIGSLASCKSGKKPVRKRVSVDSTAIAAGDTLGKDSLAMATVVDTPVFVNEDKAALIDELSSLWNKEIAFNTFSGKAKVHYEDGEQKQDVTAHIRMKKDSVIWVSVTAGFGVVSVARLYITPDSVMLINYLNKEVQRMPFSEASKMFPLQADFQTLQNFILGNVLDKKGVIIDATNFGGTWSLQVENGEVQQQATYNKADSTLRTLQMRPLDVTGPAGMIQLGNYGSINGHMFAQSRAVNLLNEGQVYYIDMNFTQAEFDQQVDFPFSIPKSYTQK